MTPTLAAPLALPGTRIPYAEATYPQLARVLAYVMEELTPHFPLLRFTYWTQALFQLQPDLWLEKDLVYLDYADLTHLTQRLATSPGMVQLDPPIYPEQARYLSRHMLHRQDQAIDALGELEANPLACGSRVFELVSALAAGNGIAHEVYRATHREAPYGPNQRDPAVARAAAPARVEALRAARGGSLYRLLSPPETAPSGPAGDTP